MVLLVRMDTYARIPRNSSDANPSHRLPDRQGVHIKALHLALLLVFYWQAIAIGSFHINIPSETKSIFFSSFCFVPCQVLVRSFSRDLKDGLPLALFSFIVCCSSLLFCGGLASCCVLKQVPLQGYYPAPIPVPLLSGGVKYHW